MHKGTGEKETRQLVKALLENGIRYNHYVLTHKESIQKKFTANPCGMLPGCQDTPPKESFAHDGVSLLTELVD